MLLSRIPYKPLALILGLFFLLFTAGLPLALTLCPMGKSLGGNVCPMCADAATHTPAKEVTLNNPPCCSTVTSSSNSAEFVQVRTVLESAQKSTVALLTIAVPARLADRPVISSSVHEVILTRTDDIPILTSSLLI